MSKGENTRDRILDRALALVGTVGLEGLSIGGLAKAAGMSKSGLFAHFDSKEDLQLKVLATASRQFIDAVISPALREARGEARVRALFERWVAWEQGRTHGGCPFVGAAHELDDRPGRLREALVSTQRDWIDTLANAARIAVEEGHFRADLDTRELAFEIYAIFLGYHLYHRLLRDPHAGKKAATAFDRLVESAK